MTQAKMMLLMPMPKPQLLRDISGDGDGDVDFAPSVDRRFLNILPLPRAFDFSELLSEVRRHRRLLVRAENAIPITAIIALFGALLFHGLIVGTFLIGLFFVPHASAGRGGRSHQGLPDVIATGAGYMYLGDLNNPSAAPPEMTPSPQPTIPLVPPVIPQAIPSLPTPPVNTIAQAPEETAIGIASGNAAVIPPHTDTPLTQDVTPPLPTVPSRFNGVPIQPPSTDIVSDPTPSSVVAHANGTSHNGSNQLARGSPDGDDDPNDGVVINLSSGSGSGRSAGGGIDRGASGADIPEPRMLDGPLFVMPAQCRPIRDAVFVLTIRADGSIGSISLKQSSGDVTADAYCRSDLAGRKFWPAYKAGKPIESSFEFSYVK